MIKPKQQQQQNNTKCKMQNAKLQIQRDKRATKKETFFNQQQKIFIPFIYFSHFTNKLRIFIFFLFRIF